MAQILLVEDDHPISDAYAFKLRLAGHVVSQAYDGLEALNLLREGTETELVLLDLRMPRMDGEQFLEKFRKLEQYKETPVIVLTNISRQEAPRTLWHLGISEYLVKVHTSPKELALIVDKYM